MSTFQRRVREDFMKQIRSDSALGENPWLRDMLRLWRPPGELIGEHGIELASSGAEGLSPSQMQTHLRLAIRALTINLYRNGQSVARIGLNRKGKIQAWIHNKYVGGDDMEGGYTTVNHAGVKDPATGQFVPYEGTAQLYTWIARANDHGGREKEFVDLVVARNPNVIDLETGLPAYSKERTAPRMDLVALECLGNGKGWQVVFWEAKLVTNGEARCQGESREPKVVAQLREYTKWLEYEDHEIQMAEECKHTCEILVGLHEVAKRIRPDIEELGIGIQEVAKPGAALPLIDKKPRLLIDDRKKKVAFRKNGHLEKLLNMGLHVQMVENDDELTLETCA